MKTVYVVKGSEDGNLAVFTTIKRAHARAIAYLNQTENDGLQVQICTGGKFPDYKFKTVNATYHNVLEALRHGCSCEIEVKGDRTTCCIQAFGLNQD